MWFNIKSIFIIPTNYICTTCLPRLILHTGLLPTGAGGRIPFVCTAVIVLVPDNVYAHPAFLRFKIGFALLGGVLSSTPASGTSAPVGGDLSEHRVQ